jgi:glycosyltransferase involved in cell wall biosynthesis
MFTETNGERFNDKVRTIIGLPTVSVVIPAMNEARNLQHVFASIPRNLHQLILVDGRSTDDTVAVARQLRQDIEVVHQTRTGKGNALACGFAAATGDVIVMLDADGSTDPSEIPRFVDALRDGADFAKGSRFIHGGGSSDISGLRRLGNLWLNKVVNILYGTRYTDLCYGYNAFWRDCLDVFELNATESRGRDASSIKWGDGFEVETLINVRIAKAKLKVTEPDSRQQQFKRIFGWLPSLAGHPVRTTAMAQTFSGVGSRHASFCSTCPFRGRRCPDGQAGQLIKFDWHASLLGRTFMRRFGFQSRWPWRATHDG